MKNYSIVIATFEDRFNKYFKQLIKSIKKERPDIEIIIQINGNYDRDFSENYRSDMLSFLSTTSNCFPQFYTKFTSLAKMWNRGILTASNDVCLVLNDDVKINDGFFNFIETLDDIETIKILNGIFSHFIVNKNFLHSVNWFDERFLGVGWEDTDFVKKFRFPDRISTPLISSYHLSTQPDSNIKKSSKYSYFNEVYHNSKNKFKIIDEVQYPYYEFERNNYSKLGSNNVDIRF